MPPCVDWGESTDVTTGLICAPGGHVVKTGRASVEELEELELPELDDPPAVEVVNEDPLELDEPPVDVVAELLVEDGGTRVKVCPSVTSVVGDVTVGRVRTCPSGRVVVSPPVIPFILLLAEVDPVLDVDDDGNNVKVSPSVMTVVGAVRLLGRVTGGFVPMITTPELDIMVWPSDAMKVVAPFEDTVLDEDVGKRVKVSPSVVMVVGAVRLLGKVTGGFVPIITTPELEMIVWPSDAIKVVAPPGDDDDEEL